MILLAIDVGNSNISIGVYKNKKLICVWRITTRHNFTSDELGISIIQFLEHFSINYKEINEIAISSVVPPLEYPIKEMVRNYFNLNPWWVGNNLPYPITIKTDNPKEVGADLVAGAYGALKLYGLPIIIVDFGTATTFSAVSKNGEFLGTAIAPGIAISAEALFSRAAKLPRIQIKPPPSPIGTNTINSMQSGFFYGFVGQVEKIIQKFKEELKSAKVVATGGLAELIAKETKVVNFLNSNLVLDGIHLLYFSATQQQKEPFAKLVNKK